MRPLWLSESTRRTEGTCRTGRTCAGARLRWVIAFSLWLAISQGCVSEGVDRLASQLVWAANWMNVTRQSERRVTYTYHEDARYWIIALPPNSGLFRAGNTGIPQTVVAVVDDCARTGQPILVLIAEQSAECVYPAYPEALNPLLVAKESGQPTTITLVRGDAGVRIADMN